MIYLLFLALATSLIVCSADISVQIPPENQFPPIARVNNSYTWTLSRFTFGDCDALQCLNSSSSSWLSFDPNTLRFSGTPSEQDEGTTDITLTAQGCGSSKSTSFTIPVKSNPPPTLNMPIASQFTASNPSLSSVFLVSPGSALATDCPSVRVPPRWSFSIGFDFQTYLSNDSDVFYAITGPDGSPLPSWMNFNPHDVTLNGVCPHELEASPQVVPLMLIASDEEGYSASTSPFNLIVTPHELSSNSTLPTINVTVEADFNLTLGSPADFLGIFVDGETVHTSDIDTLSIDVTNFDWLKYDVATRTLAGHPPLSALQSGVKPSLPVHLTTTFNQSISTTVPLDLVPSYFISNILPDLLVGDNGNVAFDISPDCSNATNGDSIVLAATYEPSDTGQYFQFDAGHLSGTIPQSLACTAMNVTLIAYDSRTHSTSHAKLPIQYCPAGHKNPTGSEPNHHHLQLSPSARHNLTLGLGITFGIIGGFGLLGCLLAAFRKCARVEDTALEGEEGRSAWSEKDKQWYGISEKPNEELGYGWSEGAASPRKQPDYGPLGLGLRRVQERSQSGEQIKVASPAVMSKREFMTRIKETVRNVSDKYQRIRKPAPAIRPVIGKPVLVVETTSLVPTMESSPSETIKAVSRSRSSTSLTRSPPAVHRIESLPRQPSCDSIASAQAHADEAVVHTASRAMSIRSGGSSSHQLSISPPLPPVPPPTRPCLVPFTSALRVPAPHTDEDSPTSSKRVISQTALVVSDDDGGMQKSVSNDELSMGLHYVCALGGDDGPVNTAPSFVTMSTNMRSSFSSLPSSHEDEHGGSALNVRRMLVRTGEQFKFRVPLRSECHVSALEKRKLVARLVTGEALPLFLHVDLHCPKYPGAVEFYGVPLSKDVGGLEVGLYTADDVCVARLSLEILARR